MKIPYIKMNGAKNDYLYFDNRDGHLDQIQELDWASLSVKLSNRKTSVGSDGIIILNPPSAGVDALARMRMFNADGSEGKMCGNGIRCLAKLLYERTGAQRSYRIETLSGIRECFILNSEDPKRFLVKVNMGRPSFIPSKIPVLFDDVMVMDEDFEVQDRTFKMSCLSMGNPHCVIEVSDLESFPVAKYGALIEKHSVFPEGVNVEFIEWNEAQVSQRTWERGSGETFACGTGACAVAVSLIFRGKKKSPVEISLKGGKLSVEWDGLREVWMTGDAVTESVGEIEI